MEEIWLLLWNNHIIDCCVASSYDEACITFESERSDYFTESDIMSEEEYNKSSSI